MIGNILSIYVFSQLSGVSIEKNAKPKITIICFILVVLLFIVELSFQLISVRLLLQVGDSITSIPNCFLFYSSAGTEGDKLQLPMGMFCPQGSKIFAGSNFSPAITIQNE